MGNKHIKIILAAAVFLVAIPFLVPQDYTTDNGQALLGAPSESEGIARSVNPLSKFYNRISSFYGFGKRPTTNNALDKLNALAKEQAKIAPAVAKDAKNQATKAGATTDATGATTKSFNEGVIARRPARTDKADEYIQVAGKTYDVVTDLAGRKYALTEHGPIPVEQLINSAIPASDLELLKQYKKGNKNTVTAAAYAKYADRGYFDNKGNFIVNNFGNKPTGAPSRYNNGGNSVFGGRQNGTTAESLFQDSQAVLADKYAGARSRGPSGSSLNNRNDNPAPVADAVVQNGVIQNNPTINVLATKLPLGIEKLGNLQKGIVTKAAVEATWGQAATLPTTGKGNLILTRMDIFNTAGTLTGEEMTKDLMPGAKFEVAVTCPSTEKNCKTIITDAWALPEMMRPGFPFHTFEQKNENVGIDKDVIAEGYKSDDLYQSKQASIVANKDIQSFNVILFDGYDAKGQLKLVSPDKYQAQIARGLFGDKAKFITKPSQVRAAMSDKTKVIPISPNKDSTDILKKANYAAVTWEGLAVTPGKLTDFYNESEGAVMAIGGKQKEAEQKQEDAIVADIKAQTEAEIAKQ